MYKIHYDPDYNLSIAAAPLAFAAFMQQDINAIAISSGGNMIVSANALYRYNTVEAKLVKIEPVSKQDEQLTTDITYCYEDKEVNLWIGCKQGLGQLKSSKLAMVPVRNSNLFNNKLSHLYGLCALDSNLLLIGTKDGLYLLKNGHELSLLMQGSLVQNIFRLTGNEVLVSGNKGIRLYTNNKLVPVESKYKEFLPYTGWQLNSCAHLSDSIYLLGTESYDGVLIWNIVKHTIRNIRDTAIGDNSRLIANNVNTVFVTRNKEAVVLSDYGFTVMKNNYTTRQMVLKNSISKPLGILMDMAETPDYYWINAYGEGLVQLDKQFKLLKVFGLKEGISSTSLYKIFNYKDSLLLLTSNNGISVFDVYKETFKTYFEEDGMQNNTFEEACGDTSQGMFYAGDVEGLVKINPAYITTAGKPPLLYITALKIQSTKNRQTDTTNLYLHSFIVPNDVLQTSIYFSGIYYNNSKRVQYAYRIKEHAKDWIYLHTQNFITLAGLAAGIHTLQVKASNEDGVWSEIKELKLIYLPKWYETIWFNIAIGLAVLLVFYGFYKFRINELKKQQQIRRSIASDLHDDIGSTLNTVKVFTHLAKNETNKNEYLTQIEKSLTEATTGLRDMIWVLDDRQDTIHALIERIKQFAIPVTSANNIHFDCHIESVEKEWKLLKTEKRNVMLMIKESINNSIKYAECRNIQVVFKKEKQKKSIDIVDDGIGFDKETIIQGNGIQNLEYRAEQIHYTLSIISEPGKGTWVRIEKNTH